MDNQDKREFPDEFCIFCGKLVYSQNKDFKIVHITYYGNGDAMCQDCGADEVIHAKFFNRDSKKGKKEGGAYG